MGDFSDAERALLKSERLGRISTLFKNGTMHLAPVWHVFDGKTILFKITMFFKRNKIMHLNRF